jgi:aryl-alcohol dehydrogenase-like predicted oxidoreductase
LIPGSATEEGTRRYAGRGRDAGYQAAAYRPLGRTGLVVSALGFGSYRVDERSAEHVASLDMALSSGINLIDTSTNYTDGSSETAIGKVLARHPRDEIVLVSKVGYVQGQALALVQQRELEGAPFPEVVKYADGCWHCIHPDFIADQLGRSLARLGVEKIDVYLLHNPEYFFTDAIKRHGDSPLATLREDFYDRIGRAFSYLEEEVRRGRIGAYGVSSNTFVVPTVHPEATSLERMWRLAGDVAADHHFTVVQLPANLFETGAMVTPNNEAGDRTALEFARDKDLAVLVNRPLNAFYRDQLIRLADVPVENPGVHAEIDPFLPASLRSATLSRKALSVLMNTPGVTSVLNGMRRRNWVEDSLGAMRLEAFEVDRRVWEVFSAV